MKTPEQIQAKIKEHEDKINELLEEDKEEWSDIPVMLVESYLHTRRALLWVLSDEILLPAESDEFEKKARYELICFESTKIF